jgi:hypothetical protein
MRYVHISDADVFAVMAQEEERRGHKTGHSVDRTKIAADAGEANH